VLCRVGAAAAAAKSASALARYATIHTTLGDIRYASNRPVRMQLSMLFAMCFPDLNANNENGALQMQAVRRRVSEGRRELCDARATGSTFTHDMFCLFR
jgi:hypothetical protein